MRKILIITSFALLWPAFVWAERDGANTCERMDSCRGAGCKPFYNSWGRYCAVATEAGIDPNSRAPNSKPVNGGKPKKTNSRTIYGDAGGNYSAAADEVLFQQAELQELSSGISESTDVALNQARSALQQRAQEYLSKPNLEEAEVRRYQYDRQLVSQAAASESMEDFTMKDAEKAHDPIVKKNLKVIAAGNETQQLVDSEYTRLGVVNKKLLDAAGVNKNRDTLMSTHEGLNMAEAGAAKKNADPEALGKSGKDKNKESSNEVGKTAQTKESLKSKLLKELLQKQLKSDLAAAAKKDKLEEMGNSFDGNLNRGEGAALSASASDEAMLIEAREIFQLSGSETDRNIASMVSEATDELGLGDVQSGILGQDSKTLFERVHAIHRACEARKCVDASKIAIADVASVYVVILADR